MDATRTDVIPDPNHPSLLRLIEQIRLLSSITTPDGVVASTPSDERDAGTVSSKQIGVPML